MMSWVYFSCFSLILWAWGYTCPLCLKLPTNYHPLIVNTANHCKSRSARLSSKSQCLYFPLLLLTTGISCTGGLVCLHLKYSAEISWSRAVENIHTHAPLWQWVTLSMPSYGRTFQQEAELRTGVLVDSFNSSFCFWHRQDGCLTQCFVALILNRLLIIWCTVLVNLKSITTQLCIKSTWNQNWP